MKIIISIIIIFFDLIVTACSSSTSNEINSSGNDSLLPPVETREPNSDYEPTFKGQTRIAGVKTKTAYEVNILTNDLNRPWGITKLPDGRFLITEKEGNLRIANSSGKLSEPITGLPTVNSSGQGGLLGLTIDPAFTKNRMVYWTFSEKSTQGNLTAVAKGKLSSDEKRIENAEIIYRATPAYNSSLHYGSRILFDKTGNLIFSTGERSDIVTRPQAQSLNSALGKIIRITTNGKPAAGNPFLNNPQARPELYSYGHRNVQSLALHPVTGDLWEGEFGPLGGDELNLIKPGKNYGWPVITFGLEYSGVKVGDGITKNKNMEQPVYYWDPVLSPSGMSFYKSNVIPEWKNNLFICGLNSNHIARLVIVNNKVTGEERLLSNEGQRFRDITEGSDGSLYVITDEGRLYRIGRK